MSKENKNYLGYVIMMIVFMIFYYGSMEYVDNLLLRFLLSGVGGIIGFFFSERLKTKSNHIKWTVLFVLTGVFILTIYSGTALNRTEFQVINGVWETDSSEEYSIRLKFDSDSSVIMSMSPAYEEVTYSYQINDNQLSIISEDISIFEWMISDWDNEHLLIINPDESLEFTKVNE